MSIPGAAIVLQKNEALYTDSSPTRWTPNHHDRCLHYNNNHVPFFHRIIESHVGASFNVFAIQMQRKIFKLLQGKPKA
jgi:hypothetical protein